MSSFNFYVCKDGLADLKKGTGEIVFAYGHHANYHPYQVTVSKIKLVSKDSFKVRLIKKWNGFIRLFLVGRW